MAYKKAAKIAFIAVKVSISIALLVYLFNKIGGATVVGNLVMLSPWNFVAAVLLYLAASVLSAIRWRLLIPSRLPGRRVFSMYMIGCFFNVCLPSTIGGDAVKAYYLSRHLKAIKIAGAKKGQLEANYNIVSLASIFMDRYVGLAALLVLGMCVFPAAYSMLSDSPVLWLIPMLLVVFIISTFILFKFRIGTRLKLLLTVYEYFSFYYGKRHILLKGFWYSIAVQLMVLVSVYVLAVGMNMEITMLQLAVFLPIVMLITLIPVSISGIGLREGAFVVLLGTIGIAADKAMTLSLIWYLSVVVASMFGFVEYLRFKNLFGSSDKEKPLEV